MLNQSVAQNSKRNELMGLNLSDTTIGHYHQTPNELAADYVNKGNTYANMGNTDKAIDCYYKALEQKPDSLPALYNLGAILYDKGDIDQAIRLYEQTIKITPQFSEGFYGLGRAVEKKGELGKAMTYFKKALHLKPDFDSARRGFNNTCRSIVPVWHFAMMNDTKRNEAYELAIEKVVDKDSVVLDIGTGSGLLAMIAARAGAKHVITCEKTGPIAEKAREIIHQNGLADRISVLNKDSRKIIVGEDMMSRADVLISEIFDVGLIGEGAIPTMNDAYERLLHPDAKSIPEKAKIYGALVDSKEIYNQGRVNTVSGFDLGKFNDFSSMGYFQGQLSSISHRFISDVFEVFSFDFNNQKIASEKRKIPVKIIDDGICHCIVFWFRLSLADGIQLDIGPTSDSHWKQAIQLFTPAVSLKKNQDLIVLAKHDTQEICFDLGMPAKRKG